MYILTDYVKNDASDGYSLFLPPEFEHRGDFAPISHGDFGLCRVGYVAPDTVAPPVEIVPRPLTLLLYAGEAYPPALARARSAVERDVPLSRADFVTVLAERLQTLLDDQRSSPFFLARCVAGGYAYKSVGSYYWIVGWRVYRSGQIVALYVSHDFFVYADPLTDFAISETQMRERFGDPKPPVARSNLPPATVSPP